LEAEQRRGPVGRDRVDAEPRDAVGEVDVVDRPGRDAQPAGAQLVDQRRVQQEVLDADAFDAGVARPRHERGGRVVGPDDQPRAVAEVRRRGARRRLEGDDLDAVAGVAVRDPAGVVRRRDPELGIAVGLDVELDDEAFGNCVEELLEQHR
jgi:hypothetical protein